MKAEDCLIGQKVYICGKYLLTQLNSVATVLDIRLPYWKPEENPAYPYGMIQLQLADDVVWGCREPWFGPEDLVPITVVEELEGGEL